MTDCVEYYGQQYLHTKCLARKSILACGCEFNSEMGKPAKEIVIDKANFLVLATTAKIIFSGKEVREVSVKQPSIKGSW